MAAARHRPLAPWLIAVSLSVTMPAGAASMDLIQAWSLAQVRDPSYAASQAAQQADQEQIQQARSALLPQIQASALAEQQERRQTSELSRHHSTQRTAWGLSLSQAIFDRTAWKRLDQAQLQAQAANLQLSQARQELMLRVSQAYFDVLVAQDALHTLRAEHKSIQEQLQSAEHMYELGGATITDTYEARARLDLVQAQAINAEHEIQLAQDRLSSLTLEAAQPLATLKKDALIARPEPENTELWSNQASVSNLEVARRELLAQAVEKRLDASSSEHGPTIALKAQTGSGSDQMLYGAQGGGPRSLNSSVGLELSIPIYTGGRISSEVREQTSRLQQARYEYQQARQQAIQDSKQYYSGVQSGLTQIRALQAAEKSSIQSMQANELAYEVGVRINIDVLNAQQQLYETQRNLAKTRYNTIMQGLRLKASTGSLSETDLQAVNQLLDTPSAQEG